MNRLINDFARRARQARRMGPREASRRVVRRLYERLDAGSVGFPHTTPNDIADSGTLDLASPDRRPHRDRPLRIGWLTMPPGIGSGGHTTMFRMVSGLESRGHECVICLYDPAEGDLDTQREAVRRGWPHVRAEVRRVGDGFDDLDACVATSWETAHVLAARSRTVAIRRLYFVQDFEPYFYARGGMYALAEDTYRFGFRTIALGEMVARNLRDEVGIEPDVVPFGCATDDYYLLPGAQDRRGVVFYAKPSVPRRGYDLARLALTEFHRRHPEQPIHIYGDPVPELPVPAVRHGKLAVPELNALYNRSIAGLAMSFTNISLVAEEMLAAGTIPVVNDSSDSRADLDNPHVLWADPCPSGLADALSTAVERADVAGSAAAAARSVAARSWVPTQSLVADIVEDEVYGARARRREGAAHG